jgi:hypothetical protein
MTERYINSKDFESLFPEYKDFYTLVIKKLDNNEGFDLTEEGHTAGHLCQGLISDAAVGFSEEHRRQNIIKYLQHIAKTKGNRVIEFIVEELKFPLPEGFSTKK